MTKQEMLDQLRETMSDETHQEKAEIVEQIMAAAVEIQDAICAASAAIWQIGRRFEIGELFVPVLTIAGEKTEGCVAVFRRYLARERRTLAGGRVLIGSVQGDIHGIGKSVVVTMLSACGFDVVDPGAGPPVMEFIDDQQVVLEGLCQESGKQRFFLGSDQVVDQVSGVVEAQLAPLVAKIQSQPVAICAFPSSGLPTRMMGSALII